MIKYRLLIYIYVLYILLLYWSDYIVLLFVKYFSKLKENNLYIFTYDIMYLSLKVKINLINLLASINVFISED
jgi:hypothetical protein